MKCFGGIYPLDLSCRQIPWSVAREIWEHESLRALYNVDRHFARILRAGVELGLFLLGVL
jgi:hypothetical protein